MVNKLYGDGIHDDTAAIQEMIDSGVREVILPAPEKFYLISKPLELPSNFRLELPRFAEVRLAEQSNCVMVKNKMVPDYAKRLPAHCYTREIYQHLWSFVDDYSPDAPCENIELCGGIWNCNNQFQKPNPEQGKDYSAHEFYGCGMLFYNVKNFTFRNLTIKDPSQYGMAMDTVSYFTVENIVFDYTKWNPIPLNMDGIHLDGNCHYGTIRNLKGTCYDDLVAINAHEGSHGPITNIEIDGIYAENCHSGVRLLLVNEIVEKIHISNVFGTYYQYVIGLTKFYPGETTGYFDSISIDHVYASKCLPVKFGNNKSHPGYMEDCSPVIWVQRSTVVKNLSVSQLHRRESANNVDTIHIGEKAEVGRLIIDDVTTTNTTGAPMYLLHNKGHIKYLSMKRVDAASEGDRVFVNAVSGKIDEVDN